MTLVFGCEFDGSRAGGYMDLYKVLYHLHARSSSRLSVPKAFRSNCGELNSQIPRDCPLWIRGSKHQLSCFEWQCAWPCAHRSFWRSTLPFGTPILEAEPFCDSSAGITPSVTPWDSTGLHGTSEWNERTFHMTWSISPHFTMLSDAGCLGAVELSSQIITKHLWTSLVCPCSAANIRGVSMRSEHGWFKSARHCCKNFITSWLVVYLPLWKIWKSVWMIIPNTWKVIKFMFQTANQLLLILSLPPRPWMSSRLRSPCWDPPWRLPRDQPWRNGHSQQRWAWL